MNMSAAKKLLKLSASSAKIVLQDDKRDSVLTISDIDTTSADSGYLDEASSDSTVEDNEPRKYLSTSLSANKEKRLKTNFCLSPISEISETLSGARIRNKDQKKSIKNVIFNIPPILVTPEEGSPSSKRRRVDYEDRGGGSGMITNNFTLSSASKPLHGRSRFNLAPMSVNYDMCSSGNKENIQNSPLRNDDVSFYGGSSPAGTPPPCAMSPCIDMDIGSPQVSPSKFTMVRQGLRARQPLEDHDANSFDSDSGYGASFGRQTKKFRFAEPLDVAPRRLIERSPRNETSPINKSSSSSSNLRIFHSLSSGSVESMDDGFMELFEMDSMDENAQLPSNLNSLISGDIKAIKTPDFSRPNFRRSLSMNTENLTPASSKVRNCLFKPSTPDLFTTTAIEVSPTTTEASRCFKRPKPPCELISPVQSKRRRSFNLHSISESPKSIPRPVLQRSFSENEASIKLALARSNDEPGLIGDFSKPFCLPLMEGRHQDLKSISPDTLALLIRGNYNQTVASFKVIDCRYPYEFEGGHITGAKNFYTKDQIIKELVQIKTDTPQVQPDEPRRHILVFHCEFSSERGPKLSRFLRNFDRDNNKESYPALHYPEIYLLHGGYKEFFHSHSDLCDPIAYRPMLDPDYDADLRHFRAKSKSFNGETKGTARFLKSRSRLNL